MNKKIVFSILGLAALVACAAVVGWPLTATRRAPNSSAVAEARAATAEPERVETLEREIRRLAARVESLRREQQEATTAATASDPRAIDESPPSQRLSDHELHEQRVVFYGAALEGEPREARSARAFEASLTDRFAKSGHSSLERVDCRSTLCRLEIRHNGRASRAPFVDLLFGPLSFGAYYYPSEDAMRTIAYVGMPGHPLPMPTPAELDPFAEQP
jgi:hypothetical protein